MAKVLVTAHLGRHFRIFGQSDYKVLLSMGHEVHIAANFNSEIDQFEHPEVIKHQIDFDRNPFSRQNLKAFKQLKELLDKEYFDLIHCQSPSGGAITRLAANKTRKKGTKVIYTAHGLHFFKGAPKKNWIMYYNFEKFLGNYTDCIITINDEDYKNAKEKLKIKDVRHVHGVGIDLKKFKPKTEEEKIYLRKKYEYNESDLILVSVGELGENKNQEMLISAISSLKDVIPEIKLLLVGTGKLERELKDKVNDLKINSNVDFLGYRNDVNNIMALSDLLISTSKREGLPVNVMEAMATGIPLIVTNCRGNRDLVKNNKNGFVIEIDDLNLLVKSIKILNDDESLRNIFRKKNLDIIKQYSIENIYNEMSSIYDEYLK